MSEAVLDTSALMAVLNIEPGIERVMPVLHEAWVSSVNLAEMVTKMAEAGRTDAAIRSAIGGLSIVVVPFDERLAYATGELRPQTKHLGLSLGDCACLALAKRLDLPAYTAERAWARLDVGARIIVIR